MRYRVTQGYVHPATIEANNAAEAAVEYLRALGHGPEDVWVEDGSVKGSEAFLELTSDPSMTLQVVMVEDPRPSAVLRQCERQKRVAAYVIDIMAPDLDLPTRADIEAQAARLDALEAELETTAGPVDPAHVLRALRRARGGE